MKVLGRSKLDIKTEQARQLSGFSNALGFRVPHSAPPLLLNDT